MTRENQERRGGHPGGERDHKNRPQGWREIVHQRVPRYSRESIGHGDRNPNLIKLLERVYGLLELGQWSEEERNEKMQQLIAILEQPGILADSERIPIRARYIHGHTYDEISVQMGGITTGVITKYMRSGIDKLSWELAVLKDHHSFRELFFATVGPRSLDSSADEVLGAVEKLRSRESEFTSNEWLLLKYRYGFGGTIMTIQKIAEVFNTPKATLDSAHRTLLAKVKHILEND